MARFPDGWIILIRSDKPTFKGGTVTIPAEDRELIMCKHCKHGTGRKCYEVLEGEWRGDNWFCADGEKGAEH